LIAQYLSYFVKKLMHCFSIMCDVAALEIH